MKIKTFWEKHSRWILWVSIAVLAVASSATGISNGFTYDDIHIVERNDRVHTLNEPWTAFVQTYWRGGPVGTLYRPFTILGFSIQWAIGGGAPWVFHATNIFLYAIVCVMFYWLAQKLFPDKQKWLAWSCAALFAVHPVHVETVGNIVGQSELTCGFVIMLALGLYIKWRREGVEQNLTPSRATVLIILYAVACLFKEHGILLLPLLVATESTLVRNEDSWRARMTNLRPFYLALVAVVVAFVYVRSMVLGEMQGDFPHMAWMGVSWSTRFWTMCIVALEWFRLFFWPVNLSTDYSPGRIAVRYGPEPEMLATFLLLGALITLAIMLRKRAPIVTYSVLWIAITLSLVSNLLFPTGIVLAERTLFLPSAGAMLLLVGLAHILLQNPIILHRKIIVTMGAFFATLLVLGAVRSAKRQPVWRNNKSMFSSMRADAPESYRGQWAYASALLKSGYQDESTQILEVAYKLFSRDPSMTDELGYRYRLRGECDKAIPLYQQVLDMNPARTITRGRLATCYMMQNKFDEAWQEAINGMKNPDQPDDAILLVRTVLQWRKDAGLP